MRNHLVSFQLLRENERILCVCVELYIFGLDAANGFGARLNAHRRTELDRIRNDKILHTSLIIIHNAEKMAR